MIDAAAPPVGGANDPEQRDCNSTANVPALAQSMIEELIAGILTTIKHQISDLDEGWIDAASVELDRLTADRPADLAKKRATIIAMARATIEGKSQESVFGLPDTGARSTYKRNWSRDPVFREVREAVTRIAENHRTRRGLKSTQAAAHVLDMGSLPAAIRMVAEIANEDAKIAITSSKEVADRTVDTASKTQTATGTIADWRADAANRRQLAAETMAAFDDADDDPKTTDLPSYAEDDPDLLD